LDYSTIRTTVFMMRPIWTGLISFGLVNIPVVLYSAEKKFDIQFKLIDSRDHAKIRYVRVNEETGEEVPWSEIAKGYEYNHHDFVVLKDTQLKSLAGEQSKTIDLISFVNQSDLKSIYFERPYYLLPDKKGTKGYVILREVIKHTKKLGICKVMIHTRQYLAALIADEQALILNLLRYQQELRAFSEFDFPENDLKKYRITHQELEIAKQLVQTMSQPWHAQDYHDTFRAQLHQWVDENIHSGKKSKKTKKKPDQKTNIIDLVSLLKKSVNQNKKTKKIKFKG
jgi:DNA end-binding protein Ku